MFGKRLSSLREKREITQEELAKYLGVSRSALALWEQGRREPSQETIKKLSTYFNVSADYLLEITDDPTPNVYLTPLPSNSKDEGHFLLEVDEAIEIDKEILKAVAEQLPNLSEEEKKIILPLLQGGMKALKNKKS